MDVLFELVIQVVLAIIGFLLLVELFVLLNDIFANVSILFLHSLGNLKLVLGRQCLFPISQLGQGKLCDVSTCQRDVLDARSDNKAIGHREHMGNTVTRVNNNTSQILGCQVGDCVIGSLYLTVKSESCLNSDKETLDAESLKHDFRHLLSIFRRVHWRLSQDESMLSWLASQVRENGLMPKLFDSLPVLDLSRLEQIANLMGFPLARSNGLVADKVVHLEVVKFIIFLYQIRSENILSNLPC